MTGQDQAVYHLVPRAAWEASDPATDYVPAAFAAEGFIHCTDGADELAATANRHFSRLEGDLLALVLDPDRITSEIRYEDARRVYPHIYGPLNRDAILRVLVMPRAADGRFLPPE